MPLVRSISALVFTALLSASTPYVLHAQDAVPHTAGTVKAVTGSAMTLTTDAGATVTVTVGADAKVLVIPPGSRDLKAATPGALADIALGDRALVNGHAGDQPTALTAARVILIKSTALAARDAGQQADWQRRGTGGIVKTVSGSVITVGTGTRTIEVDTAPTTEFRRYAADSVDFKNSVAGTLADVHPGDQLRARGEHSADNGMIKAEEVVTGTFENVSGQVATVNAPDSTLTLKDLATKKTITVRITANTDLRSLPPEAAAMLAGRGRGTGAAAPAATSGAHAGAGAQGTAGAGAQGTAGAASPDAPRRRPADLSQMLQRFPTQTLADLKPGTAVLIVASQGQTPGAVTAITLLSGVDALLTAPAGAEPFTLAPWTLGTDAGGGGGGGR